MNTFTWTDEDRDGFSITESGMLHARSAGSDEVKVILPSGPEDVRDVLMAILAATGTRITLAEDATLTVERDPSAIPFL